MDGMQSALLCGLFFGVCLGLFLPTAIAALREASPTGGLGIKQTRGPALLKALGQLFGASRFEPGDVVYWLRPASESWEEDEVSVYRIIAVGARSYRTDRLSSNSRGEWSWSDGGYGASVPFSFAHRAFAKATPEQVRRLEALPRAQASNRGGVA